MRFVDIHTHLVPALDDGAASLFEALEMLRFAYDRGTRAMVATPHMFHAFGNLEPLPVYDAFVGLVKRLQKLGDGAENQFLRELALYLGSENMVSPEFLKALERRDVLTLNGSRYLLVEFPPSLPLESARRVVDQVVAADMIPILAHVERYPFLVEKPSRLVDLRARGCVVQVNAESVPDARMRSVERTVKPLFDHRLVDIVASDAHDVHVRPPDLATARDVLTRVYPESVVALWLWENPARILENRDIPSNA